MYYGAVMVLAPTTKRKPLTMSERITTKDLDRQLTQYVNALKDLEMLPAGHRIVLDHGSKTYGRAFRIALTGEPVYNVEKGWYEYPNGSGHSFPPTGDDYLGMTKAEAYRTLNAITRALWSVKAHQNRAAEAKEAAFAEFFTNAEGA